MRKKIVFGLILVAATVFSQSKKGINVFDTVVKQVQFDNLHHEEKANFFISKEGIFKRTVYLNEDALRFHKSTEDSLAAFLKRIYPNNFVRSEFFAGETVNWYLNKDSVFNWKKGKKIATEKLNHLFTSEYEVGHLYKRAEFLKDEEDAHCFFFNYYLRDSASKTIFCFNGISGLYNGMLKYDAQNNIVYEIAYYTDRKTAMEFKSGVFCFYDANGKKVFEHNADDITCFSANGSVEWKYTIKTKKITGTENKQVGWNPEVDYISKLQTFWRENFNH
ncbi:MAG: hypothetical protein IAF38_17020 [Bacteroidia bacterium]|nr:hypothetical protein [Bacteroidia bacterium]